MDPMTLVAVLIAGKKLKEVIDGEIIDISDDELSGFWASRRLI